MGNRQIASQLGRQRASERARDDEEKEEVGIRYFPISLPSPSPSLPFVLADPVDIQSWDRAEILQIPLVRPTDVRLSRLQNHFKPDLNQNQLQWVEYQFCIGIIVGPFMWDLLKKQKMDKSECSVSAVNMVGWQALLCLRLWQTIRFFRQIDRSKCAEAVIFLVKYVRTFF